ncbi:hypothetical protein [Methylobacterium sp. ID0610]|uniref:hypothetical protein n=1 Tax=Methylobacterium carpenticola TaxID=3344827 RepID=UPI00369E0DF9
MRGQARLVIAALLLSSSVFGALSADVERLARLLIPALMAHQFASACQSRDPDFASEVGGFPAVEAFSERVRGSVLAGLSPAHARTVLLSAAAAARNAAVSEVRALAHSSADEENRRLDRWCDRSAEPFVRTIIERHEQQQETFRQEIARAKS